MPWLLLLVVAGLVLRFGIDGYNLLGDILIWLGIVLTALQFFFVAFVFNKASKHFKSNSWR